MKCLTTGLVILCAAGVASAATLLNVPMNQQINNGSTYNTQSPNGDAIYIPSFGRGGALTFENNEYAHRTMAATPNDWYYGPYLDTNLAGITTPGQGLDLSDPCTRIEFDARYFQDNTNSYGDAPIFLRIYNYAADGNTVVGYRDYGIRYGPNASNFPFGHWYPEWAHVVVYVNQQPYTDGLAFDVKNISRFRLYGTDWAGTGNDFVDVKNFIVTTDVPLPILAEVTPDPDSAIVGLEYSRQLFVESCAPITWEVTSPAGATIDANGVLHWTPTVPGQVTATVKATNSAGTDEESWQIQVKNPLVFDGSQIAAPWGILHGNIFATQSSDAPSMVFDDNWSHGAVQSWTLSVDGGLGERGAITFDEDGNLYFVTTTGTLTSVTPAGTVRWSQPGLAGGDVTTVLVGDGGQEGKVFAATADGIAAFKKSDGTPLWNTALPGCGYSDGNRLTPVLYKGAVFAISTGGTSKNVYCVSAADGELAFTRQIAVSLDLGWGDARGSVALLPDAFGANIHGLYFNADGSGTDQPDAYCVKIDMNTLNASLGWSSNGGKAARSHIVYSSTTNRLYTPTWGDDGAQFYSFDPLTGAMKSSTNALGNGHGYNDWNVLDFNGTDVLSAAGGGNVWRYHDTGDGTASSVRYGLNPDQVIDYGEFRMYGGLYKSSAGDSIALLATRSNVADEQILAFNATTAQGDTCDIHEDSAVYVDNFKITYGPTGTENTHVNSAGFEGYAAGDLPGQANPGGTGTIAWVDDTGGGPSAVGKVQVVSSLPAGGAGKGIVVDAAGGCGGWQGVFADTADLTSANGVVIVSWDQYRTDLTDNFWLAENIDYSGWYAYGWDQDLSLHARHADGAVPQTAGVWQHVEYKFDLVAKSVTVTVDNAASATQTLSDGEVTSGVRGFDFEVEGTFADGDFALPPVAPIFKWSTGVVGDGVRGLQMGPAVGGQPQRIYYFNPSGALIALTAVRPIPGDFDNNTFVEQADITAFMDCFILGNGPEIPVVGQDCTNRDLDQDGDIDQVDFGILQACYRGSGTPGDPNCAN